MVVVHALHKENEKHRHQTPSVTFPARSGCEESCGAGRPSGGLNTWRCDGLMDGAESRTKLRRVEAEA